MCIFLKYKTDENHIQLYSDNYLNPKLYCTGSFLPLCKLLSFWLPCSEKSRCLGITSALCFLSHTIIYDHLQAPQS